MADLQDRHEDHDPLLIAALLDGDMAGFERVAGESRIASCPACAALRDDLLALSIATRQLPVPARPRAFTLTVADAARLSVPITGPAAAAAHASHDATLVAALADHSLAPADRAAAEALVAGCSACAAIHADILALQAATRSMPLPARTRDYILNPTDATRLQPGGWRRFVAAFGSSRDLLSRPLAAGLTTLGLAGLLLATIPSVLTGGAASSTLSTVDQRAGTSATVEAVPGAAQVPSAAGGVAAPNPSAAASSGTLTPVGGTVKGAVTSPQPVVTGGTGVYGTIAGGLSPTPGDNSITNGAGRGAVGASAAPPALTAQSDRLNVATAGWPSALAVLSGLFLVVGIGLFAFRWSARRLGDG